MGVNAAREVECGCEMTTKFSERDWDAVVADEEAEEKAEAAFLAVLQGRHDRVKAIRRELLSLEEAADVDPPDEDVKPLTMKCFVKIFIIGIRLTNR